MKYLFSLISLLLIIACSSVKQTEKALNTGNYDQAINIAINNLLTKKDKKGKQPYVIMLKDAFNKAEARDLQQVSFLKKENNPANYERIYDVYSALNVRQEKIKPLLPLYNMESGSNVQFNFRSYDNDLVVSKNNLSGYLYDNANRLMLTNNKYDYRKAYDDFTYLNKINPNFKDTRQKIVDAHSKGTDFVIVDVLNETRMAFPITVEEDLLNFSTYGINDLWTEYHNKPVENLEYDFGLTIKLRDIEISPERINERQILKEKQVLDGKQDLVDDNGNVVKDSLGNVIQVDKFKTITCQLFEFSQLKACNIKGQILYNNLKSNQLIESFPLISEFIFEHQYATYNGDRNALDTDLINLTNLRAIPFPTNEQMIQDSGIELKARVKDIITNNDFTRN